MSRYYAFLISILKINFFLLDHAQLLVQVYFVSFAFAFPNVVISVLGKELYSFFICFPNDMVVTFL